MRIQRAVVAVAVCLSGAFSAASCGQATEAASGTEGIPAGVPTAEAMQPDRASGASGELRRWERDNLPRWTIYADGRPYYYLAGSDVKRYWDDALDMDGHCQLVAVPEGGAPETWLYLSAEQYAQHGSGYFFGLMDQRGLTVLDLISIANAVAEAGPEPPLLPGVTSPLLHTQAWEDEPFDPFPDAPVDPWTGRPPSPGGAQPRTPPPSNPWGQPPTRTPWPTRTPPHPGPAAPLPPRRDWDWPKKDLTIDKQWKGPFANFFKQLGDNLKDNIELLKRLDGDVEVFIRTDPGCMDVCETAGKVAALATVVCGAARAAIEYPELAVMPSVDFFVAACSFADLMAAAHNGFWLLAVGITNFPQWCNDKFCMPPSGHARP